MENNLVFNATLITKGRSTGKVHSVTLRAVSYDDKVYFSRRNPNSDWLKNALANPAVQVNFEETTLDAIAKLVNDEELAKKISEIKYSDHRSKESRIVLEVTINS